MWPSPWSGHLVVLAPGAETGFFFKNRGPGPAVSPRARGRLDSTEMMGTSIRRRSIAQRSWLKDTLVASFDLISSDLCGGQAGEEIAIQILGIIF